MFGDRGLGRDVLDALADRPADLVVVDCLLFGVMDAAATAGQPYVVLEHLYDAYLRGGWLEGPDGPGHAAQAAAARPGRWPTAGRRLVASLPSLDPAGPRPGPALDLRRARWCPFSPRVDADPMVLVSLSTFRFPRMAECLQTILDACAGSRRPGGGHHRTGGRPG